MENSKELRKLNRLELLEMLLEQSEELDKVKLELEQTKKELEEVNEKLKNQEIKIDEAGNIAEAALAISGIFEAAQKAIDIYKNALGIEE